MRFLPACAAPRRCPRCTVSDAPPQGQRVRWDGSAARGHRSDLAAATLVANQVVISFGQRQGEDRPGREQAVALQTRIALQPMTAKHLHDMLSRLVAEFAANQPNPA